MLKIILSIDRLFKKLNHHLRLLLLCDCVPYSFRSLKLITNFVSIRLLFLLGFVYFKKLKPIMDLWLLQLMFWFKKLEVVTYIKRLLVLTFFKDLRLLFEDADFIFSLLRYIVKLIFFLILSTRFCFYYFCFGPFC